METPATKAGRLTEEIMAKIRHKLPKLPTTEYNAIYSSVLDTLNLNIPGADESTNLPHRPFKGFYDKR
jgi:hypothetical protein